MLGLTIKRYTSKAEVRWRTIVCTITWSHAQSTGLVNTIINGLFKSHRQSHEK